MRVAAGLCGCRQPALVIFGDGGWCLPCWAAALDSCELPHCDVPALPERARCWDHDPVIAGLEWWRTKDTYAFDNCAWNPWAMPARPDPAPEKTPAGSTA